MCYNNNRSKNGGIIEKELHLHKFFTAFLALHFLALTVSADLSEDVYGRSAEVFGNGGGYIDLSDLSVSGEDCSAAVSEINRAWTENCVFRVGDISTAAATYYPVYSGETLVGANILYRTDYITADGYCDIERIRADIAAVSEEFSAAIALVTDDMTELEKAVIFHDYIVGRTEYADKTVQPNGALDYSPNEYNSVGVFLNGKAICSGYASAYAALLRASGIEAVVVTSVEMNHDWTMLKIDGSWYHADLTWDDSENGVIYDYFLKSDEEFIRLEHYGWTVGTDSVYGGYGATAPTADKSGEFNFDKEISNETTDIQPQTTVPDVTDIAAMTEPPEMTAAETEANEDENDFPTAAVSAGVLIIAAVIICKKTKGQKK